MKDKFNTNNNLINSEGDPFALFKKQLLTNISVENPFLLEFDNIKLLDKLNTENLLVLFNRHIESHYHFDTSAIKYRNGTLQDIYNSALYNRLITQQVMTKFHNELPFPIIFFKGPVLGSHLSSKVYKIHTDIDVYVEDHNVYEFSQYLKNEGFIECINKHFLLCPFGIHFQKSPFIIDVHAPKHAYKFLSVRFLTVGGLTNSDTMSDYITHQENTFKYNTVTLETHFILLCVHAIVQHKLTNFIHLYEILEFIEINYKYMNWQKVAVISDKYKINFMICFFLLFALNQRKIENLTLIIQSLQIQPEIVDDMIKASPIVYARIMKPANRSSKLSEVFSTFKLIQQISTLTHFKKYIRCLFQ